MDIHGAKFRRRYENGYENGCRRKRPRVMLYSLLAGRSLVWL